MKTLYVIRHAKSSWEPSFLHDFDRKLNARGKADALVMASRLKEKGMFPDFVVCSPAKRALKTAKRFMKVFDVPSSFITQEKQLYLPKLENIYDIIFSFTEDKQQIFLFTHNPGITEFVNDVANAKIINIPTSGIVAITFNNLKWNQITSGSGQVLFFDYPKAE